MDPRAAWAECGSPGGEGGIQNIRKRGFKMRIADGVQRSMLAVAAARASTRSDDPPTELAIETELKKGVGKGVPSKGYRLNSLQAQKESDMKFRVREAHDAAYVAATLEWQEMVRTGKNGKGDSSADGVAARFNATLPEGAYKLSGRMLKDAFRDGKAGVAPGKPGPKHGIPNEVIQAIADYASLKQAAGDEQQPRQLASVAVALCKGTKYETMVTTKAQTSYFLRRVREISGISVGLREAVDDRRWQYLTSSNLTVWFGGYVDHLCTHGFLPEECRGLGSDIEAPPMEIHPAKAARMGNGDETHQKMSNEGDARGPRASVYINEALGRAGKRTFVHGKHATIMHWLMYDGQMGAPHTMLATDAAAAKKGKASVGAQESGIRINIEWTFGVPRVNGMFGHPSVQTFEPSFVMNEKGGMEGGGFEQFIRLQIFVAFPNMQMEWEMSEDGTEVIKGPVFMQFDAGPDRYSEMSLSFRIECYQRGLILFPGLINGTAANQVCDDLFGVYKTSSAAVMDQIVAEKIAANALDPAIKVLPPPRVYVCTLTVVS